MKQSKKNKLRILNILDWPNCSCYTCGPSNEEVIIREHTGLDPITKEPTYEYNKYIWHTPYEEKDIKHYENVAETLDGVLYVNNGDYEVTTRDEYEEYLSYWHNKISENYIQEREQQKELRRELSELKIAIPRPIDRLRELAQ